MARRRIRTRTWIILLICTCGIVLAGAVKLWPNGKLSFLSAQMPDLQCKENNSDKQPALGKLSDSVTNETDPEVRQESPPVSTGGTEQAPVVVSVPVSSTQPSVVVVNPATQPSVIASQDIQRAISEMEAGLAARKAGDLIDARTRLNLAMHGGLNQEQVETVRRELIDLGEKTVFSYGVSGRDPLAEYYVVRSGDSLARIAQRYKLTDDLLATINRIRNKNLIREGMRLKVLQGPFNAAISKSEHMIYVYLQDVFVWSARVALGANGRTPTGTWRVTVRQKDPQWIDPDGRRWHPNDPANPIGDYWIGLEGIKGDAVGQIGYGIHGTIEPETIGKDVSLGCVRLADTDIVKVFELLVPDESYVTIYK